MAEEVSPSFFVTIQSRDQTKKYSKQDDDDLIFDYSQFDLDLEKN